MRHVLEFSECDSKSYAVFSAKIVALWESTELAKLAKQLHFVYLYKCCWPSKKRFAIRFRCNAAHLLLDGWNGHGAGVGRGVWMDGNVTSMGTERARVGA